MHQLEDVCATKLKILDQYGYADLSLNEGENVLGAVRTAKNECSCGDRFEKHQAWKLFLKKGKSLKWATVFKRI